MKSQKPEKKEISQLTLTLISGGFVIIGALITVLFPYFINKLLESDSNSSYSNYSESSDTSEDAVSIVSSEDSESISIPSESSSSISSLSIFTSNEPSSNSSSSSTSLPDSEPNTTTPRVIMTLKDYDAKVELFSANSGIAYIYRGFLEMNYIGTSFGGQTITGWTISLCANDETFTFEIVPIQNGTYFDIEFYSSNTFVDSNKIKNLISAELTEKGDLKVEFNFRNNPIDLSSSSKIMVGVLTMNA